MSNLQKKETPSVAEQFKVVAKQTFTKKDGTLNPVSIGLAALIIALLIGLTGTVVYRTSPKSMQEDIVNGLSSEEAQKAIQNAFLVGIDEYLNGEISEDEVYDRIMQLLADYLNSSTAFTDAQKAELEQYFKDYLASLNIDQLINDNSKNIEELTKMLNDYITKNQQDITNLKAEIKNEIAFNLNLTKEQIAALEDLLKRLEALEKKDFLQINQTIEEFHDEFTYITRNITNNTVAGIPTWYPAGYTDKKGNSKDPQTGAAYGQYEIGTVVQYKIGEEVRLFYHLTSQNGTDAKTGNPNKDTVNWQKVSLGEVIAKNENYVVNLALEGVPKWEAGKTYKIDQLVQHDKKFYINLTGKNTNTNPAEDKVNWKLMSLGTAIENTFNKTISKMYGGIREWKAFNAEDSTTKYNINEFTIYNNKLYKNITGVNGETNPAEDTTNWQEYSLASALETEHKEVIEKLYAGVEKWQAAPTTYLANTLVTYNDSLYMNKTGNNTATSPDKDKTNWAPASILQVVEKHYDTFTNTVGATEWDATKEYTANPAQYVFHNDYDASGKKLDNVVIYKCIAGNGQGKASAGVEPGTAAANGVWQKVTLTEIIDNNYQTFLSTLGALDYVPGADYEIDQCVVFNKKLYKNISGNNTGNPDTTPADWKEISVTSSITNNTKNITKNYNTFLNSLNVEEWNVSKDYVAGDVVIYDENMYKCIKDCPAGTLPVLADGTENSEFWKQMSLTDLVNDLEARIIHIEGQLHATDPTTADAKEKEFDFGYQNGEYGYYVDDADGDGNPDFRSY